MPKGNEQQKQVAVENICKVVIGDGVSQMSTDAARLLASGNAHPIRMRNLGWDKLRFERPSYLVPLEFETSVGHDVTMGSRVYDRVLMGPNSAPNTKKGDYAIRQFLRPKEAIQLEKVQGEVKDVGVVLLRGLTKILEIDGELLRRTREHYRSFMNMEICVVMTTLQHDVSKTHMDFLADEPMMAVILCGPVSGGSSIKKSIMVSHDGTGTLRIGSVTLQTFVDLDAVQGKVGPTTGRIWEIDTSGLTGDEDICDLIIELGEKFDQVEILVKAKKNKTWYAVLKSSDKGKEERTHMGRLSIREMTIPKLFERQGQYERNFDPGNLEPRLIDRSFNSGGHTNAKTNDKRWQPREESLERRSSQKNSGPGNNAVGRAGSSQIGKTHHLMSSSKHTPSLYDRYKGHTRADSGIDLVHEVENPQRADKGNKYSGTPEFGTNRK